MKKAVVIVAGGKGLRMGTDIPKQFLVIDGKPILMHTIEKFFDYDKNVQIVVVLPKDQHDYWNKLCDEYAFDISHKVVLGGAERFFSVLNGLQAVDDDCDVIAVHDGVRPFVDIEVIARCFASASVNDAVIPVVDVVETLRHIEGDGSKTVPRSDYKLVQTPQVFKADVLRKAYSQEFTPFFTDDASVVESIGYKVTLVEGNRKNIKVTTKDDLKMA